MVECEPSVWLLGNVVTKSGGMDAKREQAKIQAKAHYPASFFRSPGGNPGVSGRDRDLGDEVFRGKVSSFNESSAKACHAWNYGKPHLAKHVENGKCKFFHGCSQWVSDKGPGGQCLDRNHKKGDSNGEGCTNPKKCAKAI